MPDAPTTEGSIVAYLRMNDSDWNETLDRAEARARELGRTDPTIKVDAQVSEAIAKIEAVEAAEKQLGRTADASSNTQVAAGAKVAAAQRGVENATGQLTLAQMRLRDLQERGTPTAYQLAAAQEAVARASRNVETAQARAAVATQGLTEAQEEQTAVQNAGLSYWGKIGLAVAAFLPMLAPIASNLAASAGAFLGMGAAGVLAILGIKRAMDDGTATGRVYAQGIQSLQGNLKSLEGTATAGVLSGFLGIVQEIDRQLPSLNQEVGVFSGGLGRLASLGVQSLVRGFQVLLPLFTQAQRYVEQLGVGFNQWVTGGGLAQWASDTSRVFPTLIEQLGAFVHMIVNVLGALTPLGVSMLNVIGLASHLVDILATVLGPALGPVAIGALAAYVAFQKWETIGPILLGVAKALGLVSATVEASAGPIGWVIAAVGLLVAVLVQATNASTNATAATNSYTAAVEADSGALATNARAQAAKNLASTNAIELAKQLHISATDVTDAVLGEGDSFDQLTQQLTKTAEAHTVTRAAGKAVAIQTDETGKAAKSLLAILTDQKSQVDASVQGWDDQSAALGKSTGTTKEQEAAQRSLASSMGITTDQLHDAQDAQQKTADQTSKATQQLQLENNAAQLLTNAFQLLNGGTLSMAQAQTGAAAASNSLLDSFKKNGPVIDGNTKAAVANQQAIQQKVQADQQSAEAIANQTGSTQKGTAAFAASKVALEQQLKAQGALTPAVQAYIDKLYAIPPVAKTKVELDAAKAKADLQAFLNLQSRIRALTIATIGDNVGGARTIGAVAKADGGSIPNYLAYGGSPIFRPQGTDTVPAMLTPGEFVVKQKSAAYDPQFLKAYNANPAAALASRAGGGDVTVQVAVTGVQQEDPRIIGRLVGQGAKQALAGVKLG